MIRRYQIQYIAEPLTQESLPGGVSMAAWYQPLAEPQRQEPHLLTALQQFEALVIVPDDVPVPSCPPVTENIQVIIVRTTPRPQMPISFIRNIYRWSSSPACDLVKEAGGTYPYSP